jgi:PPK2 family polyphosphate:nucleotide phosphotransferase
MRQALAVVPGPVNLAGYDTATTPGAPRSKSGKLNLKAQADPLAEHQERLYSEATAGGTRSILLVLQGMDTAGKGGVTNHVIGLLEPIGVRYHAFKKPTEEEQAHDFLWRIRKWLPEPGAVGVFDRSHYEDVLVPRVHRLVPEKELAQRYEQINAFEAELVAGGMSIIKCFLHISYDTQRERLLARIEDPSKRWKFNDADLAERARWSSYVAAYEALLENCSVAEAPWYVVPSDSKRYRNWAIAELLRETFEELNPHYPAREDLDIEALRKRLQPPN